MLTSNHSTSSKQPVTAPKLLQTYCVNAPSDADVSYPLEIVSIQ